ncbi:GTP-binding protein, partial [Acinetobacter baumannii]
WWDQVPRRHWPDDPAWRTDLDARWDPVYGDRRQEIVFIGAHMDEAAITAALDECLAGTDGARAMDVAGWKTLEDPFPAWRREDAA